jgi:hypothetical protein
MGVRRNVRRRKDRELRGVLKRHFLLAKAEGKVHCGKCGRSFQVAVPMVPKPGAEVRFRAECTCGNQITVTLTGRSPAADAADKEAA